MSIQQHITRFVVPILAFIMLIVVEMPLFAQVVEVPLDVQVQLFLKATTFDRNFSTKLKANGVITVGICYQEKNRASVREMNQLTEELKENSTGFKLEIFPLALADAEDFSVRKELNQLSVIYLTTMRGVDVAALLKQSRKNQIMSVSTNPSLAQKGVTMSFELVDSRPKFVINRDSATAEGCNFSSQLLKLATIY